MRRIRILLAGESWVSTSTHVKGFNQFSASEYQTGVGPLLAALEGSGIDIDHLPGHLVPTAFPNTMEALSAYDAVVLSDVGADSLLLHPDTFIRGQRTPNRLRLLAEWTKGGGGLMMAGGYLSFQGFQGSARFQGTAVEAALPVTMMGQDDRMEVPEGFRPVATGKTHPIVDGVAGEWPHLLGYNRVTHRPGADVLLVTGDECGNDPLLVAGSHGAGRTLVWTSDIGPHWLPTTFSDWAGFGRLWSQAFRWLAKAE